MSYLAQFLALPLLAIAVVSVSAYGTVALFRRRRRYLAAITAFIGLATAQQTLARLELGDLDRLMLTGAGIVGASIALALRPADRERITVGLTAALVATILPCAGWLAFSLPFRMQDSNIEAVSSPNGRYTAALSYYDGLTYGYQRVRISERGWNPFGETEAVVEMVDEGIIALRWRDANTLVVEYNDGRPTDPNCPSEFAFKMDRWRGVRIEYQGRH